MFQKISLLILFIICFGHTFSAVQESNGDESEIESEILDPSTYMEDRPFVIFRKRAYFKKHIEPKLVKPDWQNHACAVRKLEDDTEVFPVALDMMKRAKKTILFNMYLFGGKI